MENKRAKQLILYESLFSSVYSSIANGAFIVGLLLYYGGGNFAIALLTAVPALFNIFSPLSVWGVRKLGGRKKGTIISFSFISLFLLTYLLPIFVEFKNPVIVLLTSLGLASFFMALFMPFWFSWFTDLIDKTTYGRFYSKRLVLSGIGGMVIPLVCGRLLDFFKSIGRQSDGFVSLWMLLILGLIGSMMVFLKLPENENSNPDTNNHSTLVRVLQPFKSREFRLFLTFSFLFRYFSGIIGPFYSAHMIRYLKMDYFTISLYGLIAGFMAILSRFVWGKLIDRFTPNVVMKRTFIGITFLPLLWLITQPNFLLPLWIDAFLTGIFWAGLELGILNLILFYSPDNEKESYFSAFTITTGIATFLGSLSGGLIAKLLQDFTIVLWGYKLINYHFLFASATLLRLSIIPLLNNLTKGEILPKNIFAKTTIQEMSRLIIFINSILKSFRRLSRRNISGI